MTSLESSNNFIVNSLRTLMYFAPAISLVEKQYFDTRFVENQVIRDAKIELEKFRTRPQHPLFFFYNCETSTYPGLSNIFYRQDLESFLRPTSDSVLIPSLLAMIQFLRDFSTSIGPPPEFFLKRFQLYRCLPLLIQWPIFIWFSVLRLMAKGAKSCCIGFWSTVWSGWCWIYTVICSACCLPCTCIKKIFSSPSHRERQADPENPSTRQNGISTYGSVQNQTASQVTITTVNEQGGKSKNEVNEHVKLGNNEVDTSSSPTPPIVPITNNEPPSPAPFDWKKELESLKKESNPDETVTLPKEEKCSEDIDAYKQQLGAMIEERTTDENIEKIKELNRTIQEQKEQYESLKKSEPAYDDGNEEIQRIEDAFQKEQEAQARRHKEELENVRRKRREAQNKLDEELIKMKEESQQRLAALLLCIQMNMRFAEKEEEWGDFLKVVRSHLTKASNSSYDLQDEFRMLASNVEEGSDSIVSEIKFFAKSVNSAQNVLANAYYYLEEQSEKYQDRIFLKMIMKSIIIEGHHCDSIGENLVKLIRTPLDIHIQNKCTEAISKLNAHSIPTTQKLKNDSVYAKEEDYLDMGPFPEPDWFSSI